MIRVLNGYAGIGGNRHLWPSDWAVTAVEWDPKVAAEYARRYPNDTVIVADAHAYLLEHAAVFDAIWVSPPCPTHSKLAKSVAARAGVELQPDPRLWHEIDFLRTLGVPFVVENVHTYYEPPVAPDLVTDRHYYWATDVPLLLTPPAGPGAWHSSEPSAAEYAVIYGLPPVPSRAVSDARKAFRNAVEPVEGYEVATAAFAGVLAGVSA